MRGPSITYQIRKTTTNNKTGDNFAITIPRFVAEQFSGFYFKLTISGDSIIFTSGCKLNSDVENKIFSNFEGGVIFK